MAVLLENAVRAYAWGSPEVIPRLLGQEPTGEPQAELWVGAHSGGPSVVAGTGTGLDDYLAADPARLLGAATLTHFGATLPFLLKVLAVERPLSIQVHPTRAQAAAGFAAEDAAEVALDDPRRCYRDTNHKPEMVVALTEFEALLGFRRPEETAALLRSFGLPALTTAASALEAPDGLEKVARSWLSAPDDDVVALVADVVGAAPRTAVAELVANLAAQYPGDRGVLLALLLRHVRLAPGEAAFVDAGVPHAYLHGVAIEPQASSDNTLRAGLTPKYVDVDEVAALLRYEPDGALLVEPVLVAPGRQDYPVPGMTEFLLSRIQPESAAVGIGSGPRLVLVVDGTLEARTAAGELSLQRGQAGFAGADEGEATLHGDGVAFSVGTAIDTAR